MTRFKLSPSAFYIFLPTLLYLAFPATSLSIEQRKHLHPALFLFPYSGRGDPDHSFLHPYSPSYQGDPITGWFQMGTTAIARSSFGRDVVRLTSASQANQGILYNHIRTDSQNFNGYIDVQMDSSRESQEPADGMGLFFTRDRPKLGSAMGMTHTFQGLGIIIDTFSNSRTRRVPYVYAYVSDGTKTWNPGFGRVGHGARARMPGRE
uniref:Glycoprotein n=1 Tax=Griffithsia japonica TaxID=83288 RepID=Q7XZ35_GRIJA|nr:glycoprotein [Griffithsia japonica]